MPLGPTLHEMADVRTLVDEVVAASYPELANARFDYKTFDADTFYFRSSVEVGPMLWPGGVHRYIIAVNPRVFELGLDLDAARSVLAHELGHTWNYETRGLAGVLGAAWGEISRRHEPVMERRTDLVAIGRGYGPGLAAYRTWIYTQLSADAVARKKVCYFSPEEISALDAASSVHPDLATTLWRDIPLTPEETRTAIASLTMAQQ